MIITGKVQTWNQEIDGLYDYDNKIVSTQELVFNQTGLLARVGDKVSFINSMQQQIKNQQLLASCFKVEERSGNSEPFPIRFVVAFDKLQMKGDQLIPQEKAYLVVKSMKRIDGTQRGYPLKVGDYIKFGRIEYFLKQIRDEDGIVHKAQTRHRIGQRTLVVGNTEQNEQKIDCRICLDDTNTVSNPLVNACHCKGTINYIHVECLNECLKSRIKQKIVTNVTSYKIKSIKCEICKADYPTKIVSNSSRYSLLSLQKPTSPYMLLQSSSGTTKNFFFVQLLSNQIVSIGRGHDAQINIQDVTVSRFHGWITKDTNNQYLLFDNSSKFGTLIELKDHLKLSLEPIQCQVGRSLITLSVQ